MIKRLKCIVDLIRLKLIHHDEASRGYTDRTSVTLVSVPARLTEALSLRVGEVRDQFTFTVTAAVRVRPTLVCMSCTSRRGHNHISTHRFYTSIFCVFYFYFIYLFIFSCMCLTVHCIVYLEIALRVRLLHN